MRSQRTLWPNSPLISKACAILIYRYANTLRFDKLGGDQLHRVTMLTKTASPIMRPAASFHADNHRGQPCDKGEQRLPSQAFPKHDFPLIIHPGEMKDPLCQIDPDDTQMLLHWTRLLLGGMIAFQLKSF